MTSSAATIRVPGQFASVASLAALARKPSGLAPAPVAPDHMFTIAPHSMEAFGALVKSWAKAPETAPVGRHSVERFAAILDELVAELPRLRTAIGAARPLLNGSVARRMAAE